MKAKILYSSLLAIALLSGCGGDSSNDDKKTEEVTNKAPMANAGADKTITVDETITITGTANDSDGTVVSYEWKKGNSVLSESLSFDYTPTTVGTDTLTLSVMDDGGLIGTDEMKLFVEEGSDSDDEDSGGATITQN